MKKSMLILLMLSIVTLGYSQKKAKSPFTTKNQVKRQAVYNINGTLFLPQLILDYDWQDSVWSDTPDSTYNEYNSNGDVISTRYINVEFGFKSRTTFEYNNGFNTASYSYNYNTTTGEWDTSSYSISVFDNLGNEVKSESYFRGMNGWELSFRDSVHFTYTGNRVDQEVTYQWNKTTSSFYRTSRSIYNYNAQNIPIELTYDTWDTTTNTYLKQERFHNIVWHLWDGSLESSLISSYQMDEWDGNAYDSLELGMTEYDNANNIIEEKYEAYNGVEWELDYWTKYAHTYNTDGALTQTIQEDFDGTEFVNTTKNVYSNFFTGLKNVVYNNASVSIYPNPISDKAYISIGDKDEARFFMYDITGRTVNSLIINNGEAVIEKGNLLQGVYFYRLIDAAGAVSTGKVVIK
jgi:hypothetical protein